MTEEVPPTELWRDAFAQVDDLLQRTETERNRALADLAQSHPQLHSIVAALLEADRDAEMGSFLEPRRTTALVAEPEALLGPYRLIRRLGEGGMGEVWLAQRSDGLYEREVAIKTLHPQFAGSALRERFLREAHLLGRLTHPNIARLIDAGVSPSGVPYLVLEYVRGSSIEQWCDERRHDVKARLRLFIDVCAAVAHAHANLIVHRDIKPSNILVTEDGTVKLLDFGVSKLIESDAADATELTRYIGHAFTPEYAAPEQITGDAVTTATDVYSLGVLLYLLMVGRRPHGTEGANTTEVSRAVLHDDIVKPSRAVHDALDESAAANRSTTRIRLRRALAGDIDNIVVRALAKTPGDRYPSALALAEDIRRHLADEPVLARAEPLPSRARKFVRRNRTGVASAAVVVIAIAAGIGAVLKQSQIAREQAAIARAEASKATAIKNFLIGLFNTNARDNPRGVAARSMTAEQLLHSGGERILSSLQDQPELRAELLDTLGDISNQIEDYPGSETLYRERVHLLEGQPRSPAFAAAIMDLSSVVRIQGRNSEALELAQRAASILDELGEHESVLRGTLETTLGEISWMIDSYAAEPVAHYRRSVAILERHGESAELVMALLGFARALESKGDLAAAATYNRRGIETGRRVLGERATPVAGGYQQLARVLRDGGDLVGAQASLDRAIEIFEFAGGPAGGQTVIARAELALLLRRRGMLLESADRYPAIVRDTERAFGPDNRWTLQARLNYADALRSIGALTQADDEMRATRTLLAKTEHARWMDALADRFQAPIEADLGRTRSAALLAARAVGLAREIRGANDPLVGEVSLLQAQIALVSGELATTESALREAQRLLSESDRSRIRYVLLARTTAAELALRRARPMEALQLAQQVMDQLGALDERADLWEVESLAHLRLAEARLAAQDFTGACKDAAAAIALREPRVRDVDPMLALMRLRQARCMTALR